MLRRTRKEELPLTFFVKSVDLIKDSFLPFLKKR